MADFSLAIGSGHDVRYGWINGELAVAFCIRCGRQRCGKGRGLVGGCRPEKGQKVRLKRICEGRHPGTGEVLDLVRGGGTFPVLARATVGCHGLLLGGGGPLCGPVSQERCS